ncbi:MAG: mechanosensitive ion channel family protein [Coraliomargarita sp.]
MPIPTSRRVSRIIQMLFLVLVLFRGVLLFAQDAQDDDVAEQPTYKLVSDKQAEELRKQWAEIEGSVLGLDQLQKELDKVSGGMSQVLKRRRDSLLNRAIELSIEYCMRIADLQEAGYDLGEHHDNALWLLEELPPGIERTVEGLHERRTMSEFSQSALEQIAMDRQFVEAERLYRRLNLASMKAYEVALRFNIDLDELRVRALEYLDSSAVNTSVFLELALAEVRNLRASIAVMPEDAELQAKLRVAELRVRETIKLLTDNVEALRAQGLPTAQYQRQLLSASGAVTTVSLDVNVLLTVLRDWWQSAIEYIRTRGLDLFFQALLFLLIVYVFYRLSGVVHWIVNAALKARHVKLSQLMSHMIASIARSLVIVAGVFIALSQFNVSVGPMLAGLGIAGFIIGFALQDSLSNFASGMMILFYKPFDVGDTVIAADVRGKVRSMSLVNTTICTPDNQSLIIPNNMIWQNVITNVTDQEIRRVDMEFGITYDEDIDRVENILRTVLESDERVLHDPEPQVMVGSFGDSSVNVLCRPWVRTEDYWTVRWDLNKHVKQAFDREGVVIPFPQRDVNFYPQLPPETTEDA